MKLLTTITSKKENYTANIILDERDEIDGKPSLFFFGDMDNDVDGTPYWENDKYGAPDTSLHYLGKAVNGDIIPFIVLPPEVINLVKDTVLGCLGEVYYKDKSCLVVVADVGPHFKLGEGSPAALRALELPAFHNGNGGLDTQEVLYRFWPGVAANLTINEADYQFQLQPLGH